MKRIILTIAIIAVSIYSVSASGNFKKEMKKNLTELREYNDDVDYKMLATNFAEISQQNPKRFEPLYYAAFCHIMESWSIKNPQEKEEVLKIAYSQIEKAKKIKSNNDEIFVLEAFYYQALILVNPRQYGPKYSAQANQLLTKAQKINDQNPRAEFLLAQNMYYRPEKCGGGKDIALPLFEKADKLFKSQETSNYLLPQWGNITNSEMIEVCKK